jgi:hypothetical protein
VPTCECYPDERITLAADRVRSERHALSCVAARGGRLHAGMMLKPNRARLTSDAALRLS